MRHCDHFDRAIIGMVNLTAVGVARGLEDGTLELEIGNMTFKFCQVTIIQFVINQYKFIDTVGVKIALEIGLNYGNNAIISFLKRNLKQATKMEMNPNA